MTTDETPYVLWKATFTLPLDEATNPLYEVCRMPHLVRTPSEASIYTLLIDLDRRNDAITFSPYIKVVPDKIHLVHAQLQRIRGYVGFVQIQEEPGDPFDEPQNPTILSFANFEPSWLRPFNVIGKVSDVKGLQKDVTGWFWTFNLFDAQGHAVHVWFYTENEDGMEEGEELPNVNEGDLALCVNVTPNLEEGIRIGKRSELLIFRE
ncbi:hypothetical protein sr11037 [Sporisorium reilianum SRZ2]|uniref:Uncharacterized protein n=2 Tax=Sporisorium reilianum TaxID=72558 RepID=E7A0D1_SPORE|nr:hypothetical protein sr11037 [Sporisorium reilianum SRZ2]SJX62772.1 uncharacterized protein SRS1_11037 [Sporisorium reilianum f. sp. reilianum]